MPRFKFFHRNSDEQQTLDSQERPFPPEVDEHKDPIEEQNKDLYSSDGESISSGQDGVKKAQATTIVWSRKSLIIAYAL
jgi:hypothetical protein